MSNIYQEMVEVKEEIMKNFYNNEINYEEIIAILDNIWSVQLHHPLHVIGHYLNPK